MEKWQRRKHNHTGSSFDRVLEEQGIGEEVEAVAMERVLAWKLAKNPEKKIRVRAAASALPSRFRKEKRAATAQLPLGPKAREKCAS